MSNKVNITFSGTFIDDQEKNKSFVTLKIDTTINGSTSKRIHNFDDIFLDKEDLQGLKNKIINIIFDDLDKSN